MKYSMPFTLEHIKNIYFLGIGGIGMSALAHYFHLKEKTVVGYDRVESIVTKQLEEKGIKQTWLAEQLGKSYNMVNGYVQNRQQPRIEVLYDIAKILDVNVKDLLIDNDIKKNKK